MTHTKVITSLDDGAHRAEVLVGVSVDAVSTDQALKVILTWAKSHACRYVVFANAHIAVSATQSAQFATVVRLADLVLPDGAPVAWMLRKLGHLRQERLSGPDLTWDLLRQCERANVPVYFYGSTEDTLDRLAKRVRLAYPALCIAGTESPPFRTLTTDESLACANRINSSGAALVFVGLGCPKQEQWMFQQRGQINAVMLGVGAAFDFHAGTISRAPVWMRQNGLEWLHRLATEPRRLWRRYLITNTLFLWGAMRRLTTRSNAKP